MPQEENASLKTTLGLLRADLEQLQARSGAKTAPSTAAAAGWQEAKPISATQAAYAREAAAAVAVTAAVPPPPVAAAGAERVSGEAEGERTHTHNPDPDLNPDLTPTPTLTR